MCFILQLHGKRILKLLQKIFSWLPLATVIDQRVLIVHGGISDTTDLALIGRIDRHKVETLYETMAQCAVLWYCMLSVSFYVCVIMFPLASDTPIGLGCAFVKDVISKNIVCF